MESSGATDFEKAIQEAIPLLLESIEAAQKLKEYKDGVFLAEAYRANREKLEAASDAHPLKPIYYMCIEGGVVPLVF